MPFLIRISVKFVIIRSRTYPWDTLTYSSAGNSEEVLVEVVIGRRQRPCALSKNGDLSWLVTLAGAGQRPVTYPAGISTK